MPRSRSRTTAMAVAKVVPICRTTPITPGTIKVRAAHRRVVKHLRTHLDRHVRRAALAHQSSATDWVKATRRAVLSACSAVVEFEPSINICTCGGMSGAQIAREMRRDLQADVGVAFANLARQFVRRSGLRRRRETSPCSRN